MKLVIAIIRPEMYGAVEAGLGKLGIDQLTITEVLGRGHERGQTFIYRGTTFQDTRIRRLKLEIVVEDDAVDGMVEAIQVHARTGEVGDGVILVTPVEGFVRIRTGQYVNASADSLVAAGPRRPVAQRGKQPLTLGSRRW
jgi:nitrogen regulatory protein PII